MITKHCPTIERVSTITDNDYLVSGVIHERRHLPDHTRSWKCHHIDEMRSVYIIVALIAFSFKVDSAIICESRFCVCHHNNKIDGDLFGEIVNCSYDPLVLKSDYELPETSYSFDLSRNNLTSVQPSNLLNSDTLTELSLSNNVIKELSTDAFRFKKLKRLDLSYNNLEFINKDTFKYIKQLEYLNLANNKFTTFEKISFHHLRDLKEIVLDHNDLGPSLEGNNLFDRSGYGLTHKIQSLSISGIKLDIVHENFFVDAFDLKRLTISNNNIVDIFELPFTLEYLDLSDNPIGVISGEDFADLLALKELKLNNLLIKEVPDYVFATLHSLTSLQLERNKKLIKFSVMAFGQEVLEDADDFTLEKLSLRDSRLTTLDKRLELPFGQLIRLNLQGNFWNCDCNLVWLKQLHIHTDDSGHLRCYTPKSLINSRISDLEEKYFTCPSESRLVGGVIALITLFAILTAIALWIFIFLHTDICKYNFISNLYAPSGYSGLPINPNVI